MAVSAIAAWLFFDTVWAAVFLSPLLPYFLKWQKGILCKKRKDCLGIQFKDALQSISTALQAGYSMENAVLEAEKDMENMYGPNGFITREFYFIRAGIANNRTLEELFGSFADRSGVEDICDFAEIFAIAKRSGGNLTAVIRVSSTMIGEKIETEKEIRTLLSAKRLEGRLMDIIPCLMICYIRFSSPGFLDLLYHTWVGRMVMAACLGVYAGAVLLSEKIMSIEV